MKPVMRRSFMFDLTCVIRPTTTAGGCEARVDGLSCPRAPVRAGSAAWHVAEPDRPVLEATASLKRVVELRASSGNPRHRRGRLRAAEALCDRSTLRHTAELDCGQRVRIDDRDCGRPSDDAVGPFQSVITPCPRLY
jgi:hypothetical protein